MQGQLPTLLDLLSPVNVIVCLSIYANTDLIWYANELGISYMPNIYETALPVLSPPNYYSQSSTATHTKVIPEYRQHSHISFKSIDFIMHDVPFLDFYQLLSSGNSHCRTRTYNTSVNSRMLYHWAKREYCAFQELRKPKSTMFVIYWLWVYELWKKMVILD